MKWAWKHCYLWPATLKPCSSSCLMSSIPFISPSQSPHYQPWAAAAGLCDGEGAGGLWVAVLAAGLFWHFIRQWDLSSERVLSDESVPLALCVWRPAKTDVNELLKETLVINYRKRNKNTSLFTTLLNEKCTEHNWLTYLMSIWRRRWFITAQVVNS